MHCTKHTVRETGCGVYSWVSMPSETIPISWRRRMQSCVLIFQAIESGGVHSGASCGLWPARTRRLSGLLIIGASGGLWARRTWWSVSLIAIGQGANKISIIAQGADMSAPIIENVGKAEDHLYRMRRGASWSYCGMRLRGKEKLILQSQSASCELS